MLGASSQDHDNYDTIQPLAGEDAWEIDSCSYITRDDTSGTGLRIEMWFFLSPLDSFDCLLLHVCMTTSKPTTLSSKETFTSYGAFNIHVFIPPPNILKAFISIHEHQYLKI